MPNTENPYDNSAPASLAGATNTAIGPCNVPSEGSVIHLALLSESFNISIPLAQDQQSLQAEGQPALTSPNCYTFYIKLKGFGAGPAFEVKEVTVPFQQSIADYAAQTDDKAIDISAFPKLGRSGSSEAAIWEIWYAYFDAPGGNQIAESQHISGILDTRPIA